MACKRSGVQIPSAPLDLTFDIAASSPESADVHINLRSEGPNPVSCPVKTSDRALVVTFSPRSVSYR